MFARIHGYADNFEDLEVFETLVSACDHAFLEFADEKLKSQMAALKAKNSK